jgi:hypothetical protein
VLGNDVRMTWVNNNYCMEGIVHERDGQWHVDPWGIKWVKEGPYNEWHCHVRSYFMYSVCVIRHGASLGVSA